MTEDCLGRTYADRAVPHRAPTRCGRDGVVYLGRDARDGRPVAVKVIRPELAADPKIRNRLRREVKAARRVPRFCTAQVLAANLRAEPPYVVTEYIDAPTLDVAVLERGPLAGAELAGLAAGVALEPRRRLAAFLDGMLAELPRKNCWTIAEHAGESCPGGMQHFLNRAVWDTDGPAADLRGFVVDHLGEADAVLVIDETGDVKKGDRTVGVQRHTRRCRRPAGRSRRTHAPPST